MSEFEDYSFFGSTRSPLQPYVSCHECLQHSRFWVPGCDPCLPAVCDHLSWATIFAWPTGWSLYAGFTVLMHIYASLGLSKLSLGNSLQKYIVLFFCGTIFTNRLSFNPHGRPLPTHWGWVTHICISNLTITSSDNGLSPWRQAITWSNDGILSISSTQVSDSHLSPPGALQSRRASLQWT